MIDLTGKSVLVTGGTGSFGNQFVETVLRTSEPERLIIYSRDELKQHQMQQRFDDRCMRYLIGDVRDAPRLQRAMHDVNVVVHAAALKQVPAAEYNPFEAVKTNIIGATNVIDAAIDAGVERVIALSTDKAVNPINLYGATKLCAEKLFIQGNAYVGHGGSKLSCVRYGNVIASRGSVIPLFIQQRRSGSVTVTDRRMTRFWITLDQGVEFVLSCLEVMEGGEVFAPKIPSMSIMDLVEAVAPDCDVNFIDIRPGEKLHELLISQDEARQTVELPNMYVIQPAHSWWETSTWEDGTPVADGFAYGSDTNNDQLSISDLRAMLDALGIERSA